MRTGLKIKSGNMSEDKTESKSQKLRKSGPNTLQRHDLGIDFKISK